MAARQGFTLLPSNGNALEEIFVFGDKK